ncbi:MAG: YjdF family protein [Anaerolineae bacterium]|nr:YjdF family protein [Anaerolineae bacterium]
MNLTILFENPYWIGLIEFERDGLLYAARHIFGAEPCAQAVYDFVQKELDLILAGMTTGIPANKVEKRRTNPKRAQREIRRAMSEVKVSTKAQDAMRAQLEQNKCTKQEDHRQARRASQERRRHAKTEKAKAKRRGR